MWLPPPEEYLRTGSALQPTLVAYESECGAFMSWARQRRFPLPRSDKASARSKVDRAMSLYIASLYADGLGPSKARLVLYGWILLHTDAEAKDGPFPRAQRVMRGFTAKTVSDTKLPLPEPVVFSNHQLPSRPVRLACSLCRLAAV